ncbi:MAG: DUF2971 domain-containing protein [Paracoccaceae bacterium]
MEETTRKLMNLFMPHAMSRVNAAREKANFRFAYYTSASTGMKLLQNNEAWLRNAALMNDFSEIHHGQDCLYNAWTNTKAGLTLKSILTLLDPNAVDDFAKSFNAGQAKRTKQTFILCLSEHGDPIADEDKYGRLSMWRAYGGNTNVCLVLNSKPFLSESSALDAITSPVLYKDIADFEHDFQAFVDGLDRNLAFLREIGWVTIHAWLLQAMKLAVLSTKHPGFIEEKEWRVIFSPEGYVAGRIKEELVTLDGIPQKIFKIPFKNYPEEGLTGVEIPELLDRIIIGPTEFPFEIKQAFVDQLDKLGIKDADKRVVISGVPLRRK